MQTYISILRGINVSGQKKIQMTDLKMLYEDLKFKNVTTYIENAITEKYHFHVPVIIRSIEEMKNTLVVNPLLKEPNVVIEKLHVTFLEELPDKAKVDNIKDIDYSPDKFIIIGKEIFL